MAPVGSHATLHRSKPKPHRIKVHSVSRHNVCFSVHGGVPKWVVLKGGQSPEDAITEFIQDEDEKEAREEEELRRIQEELDKRF